jgi:endoglucanase Acf2
MAKLARIIAIADELVDVCTSKPTAEYVDACNGLKLPQLKDINHAVDELRESVEIWFNGKAVTPFVYDSAWGGVVSCGCDFDDKTKSCKNHFPDNCPAFTDPGLDFGNGMSTL